MPSKKKYGPLAAAALALAVAAGASSHTVAKPEQHRVVFELTSDDPKTWEAVLNNVDNVRKALGKTAVEVVAHGPGLELLVLGKAGSLAERLGQTAKSGVVFAACENTMKRKNIDPKGLVPHASPVDSGVAEVVRKQEAGWSYIRSGL